MDKKTRLKLIRKAYQDSRRHKRRLTPKAWQLIKEIREENEEVDPDVVVDFSDADIHEEIQLIRGARHGGEMDLDWDPARYYDSNTSAEMLYFRRDLD